PAVQRDVAQAKSSARLVVKPLIIKVFINGRPAWALLDSGSLGDFLSSSLADQLNLKREMYDIPVSLHLAVQGSQSKITAKTQARFVYDAIDELRTFDIINISRYDLILGTAWLYQHSVCIGFNPACVAVRSDISLPLAGKAVAKVATRAIDILSAQIGAASDDFIAHAEHLCK
ncbi:hypothetical protein BDN70DRAFT_764971, partial [Pholiota conissans]